MNTFYSYFFSVTPDFSQGIKYAYPIPGFSPTKTYWAKALNSISPLAPLLKKGNSSKTNSK